MANEIEILTELARDLKQRPGLEELLQLVVERAQRLIEADHVSLRLLDPSRGRLLAVARSNAPFHGVPDLEFRPGEGLIGWVARHAASIVTGDAMKDPRFMSAPMKEPIGSFVGVPLMAGNAAIGVLSAIHRERDAFTRRHEELLTLLATICAPQVEMARLARLSQVDPLTGALNRRGLDMAYPEVEIDAQTPLSVALADIDHFKQVNDQYGHAIGDEVLKRVALMLSSGLREGDAVVRYGGEEFLLILPRAHLDAAARIAQRARETVEQSEIVCAEVTIAATLSFGVAERQPGEGRDALIKRADAALYAAKQGGRNRVEMAR